MADPFSSAYQAALGSQPQQNPMAMLMQLMQLKQAQEQGEYQKSRMAHEAALRPLQMQKMQAEIESIPELAAKRRADAMAAQIEQMQKLSQIQGQNRLGELLNAQDPSQYTQGSVPNQMFQTPDAAREAMMQAEARGIPFSGVSPNQGQLQNTLSQADPKAAIAQMMKNLNPTPQWSPLAKLMQERDKLPQGDPRRAIYEQAIEKSSTHQAPVNVYSGGLERGVDPQGRHIFVQGSGRADTPPRVVDPAIAVPPPTPGGVRATLLGANESAQLNRVLMGGNQVAKALGNIVNIPISSSSGIFGGRSQGSSLFEAGKESLTNTMTTQEVQTYNVLTTGIQRSLAAIESAGLAPTNSLMHMMQAVTLKEGDTQFTKLLKLAETRQVVEAAYEVVLSNPRVSESQKKQAQEALDAIRSHVPFTPLQVMQLNTLQQENPKTTMKDIMTKAKSGGAPQAAIDYLKANPGTKDAFKEKYGYLPEGF